MNALQSTEEPAGQSPADKDAAATTAQWNQLIAALTPHAPELVHKLFDTIKSHSEKSLTWSTVLLVAIVVALTGLAAYSLFLGKVDTAEKIVIAMVSFLGGTALFGGGKK